MSETPKITDKSFWAQRWQEKRTGWDFGRRHPHFDTLWNQFEQLASPCPKLKILVPGCGRGHNAAVMAKMGHEVFALDLTEEAKTEGEKLYGEIPTLTYYTEDFFRLDNFLQQHAPFDLIFDRAMMCALPPELWKSYIDVCHQALKPGGYFLSIPFTVVDYPEGASGPPFAISNELLTELITPKLHLCWGQEHRYDDTEDKIRAELLSIWKKA